VPRRDQVAAARVPVDDGDVAITQVDVHVLAGRVVDGAEYQVGGIGVHAARIAEAISAVATNTAIKFSGALCNNVVMPRRRMMPHEHGHLRMRALPRLTRP